MAEIRQLRAIVVSDPSGRGGHHAELSLFVQDSIGLVETGAATGRLAERSIARFRIARDVTRGVTQLAFPDGVADTDVHSKTPATDSQEHI